MVDSLNVLSFQQSCVACLKSNERLFNKFSQMIWPPISVRGVSSSNMKPIDFSSFSAHRSQSSLIISGVLILEWLFCFVSFCIVLFPLNLQALVSLLLLFIDIIDRGRFDEENLWKAPNML